MIYTKAKLTSYKKNKNTYKLVFTATNSINDLILEQYKKTDGFIVFSPDELKKSVEEAIKNKKIGVNYENKSKSEILRGKIYEIWHASQSAKTFDQFYIDSMDYIIKFFSEKYL